MGRLAPTTNPAVTRAVEFHPCDACGVSKIDGGHIANAKYRVEVSNGHLYFCGSHMRRHWVYVREHGYEIVSLST